jgi:16S rRNA (cytidine1402-2'-O)-methyltransferase
MLYLVATPIGNLGDITLRALDTLREADVVVSEDTRKTGMMLKHFEIKKPQISFYEPKEARALPKILALLEEGKSVALVSNAGSPAISDPGFTLVRAALEAGLPVTAIPGPTAVITVPGAVGPARAQFYLSRLPAPQTGRPPPFHGSRPGLAPHPDLLREPAPPEGFPRGRPRRLWGPPRRGGQRSDQNV